MIGHINVVAVIVTFNRIELLKECVEAVINQTYSVDKLIIVDNCSTDGTKEYLRDLANKKQNIIIPLFLDKNNGCSGGFNLGMKKAISYSCDWMWLMDDDTIPQADSLERLINAINYIDEEKTSFLSSLVINPNNSGTNIQTINYEPNLYGEYDCYKQLNKGILKVLEASFVSLLVNKLAIDEVGYPCAEYFIWGDDFEYTMRMNRKFGPGYLVGDSVVLHKRQGDEKLDIVKENNINRINNFHYYYRNTYITASRYWGVKGRVRMMYRAVKAIVRCFSENEVNYRGMKSKVIIKGIISGIFFSGKIVRE